MTTIITSITISRTQIAAVIQDWLNAHILRQPVQVTSYELDDCESITISRAQIAAVIQDWLNAHILRQPVQVTSYELDDCDVQIAIAPAPAAPPVPSVPSVPSSTPAAETEEPAAPPPAPKSAGGHAMPRRNKLTVADVASLAIHRHTSTPAELARALGVAKSVVQKWLDENPTD